MSESAEKDAGPVPPDCESCGRPLGLYYAECATCLANAGRFSYFDYARLTPPEASKP